MLILPQTTQKTNKMSKREWGERKRKLFCFFLLGSLFLAESGLKLDLLLAMGPGILPHTCSCSQAAPACWSQGILQKINEVQNCPPLQKGFVCEHTCVCDLCKNPVKIFCFIKSLIYKHFRDTVEAD